ncbi:sulfatase, partial [gut metagenome]
YHQRYTTWDAVRGQEGDAWQPLVHFDGGPACHRNICGEPKDNWVGQDFANRSRMTDADQQPQSCTFQKGLAFLEENHNQDNWFLQIETFDPHEPFFVQPEYQSQFQDNYTGPFCDWPDYRPVNQQDSPEFIDHIRQEYAALLKMCDDNLGRVLDAIGTGISFGRIPCSVV